MLAYQLTDEQRQIQEMARDFADSAIAPIAREVDLQDLSIPESLLGKMATGGFFGMLISPEYGGAGLDAVSVGLVTEQFCRASLGLGSVIQRNLLVGDVLEKHGTGEQKQRWLPGIASGALQTCTSGTEPEAGSDAASLKTRADREGDFYVLNGAKQWSTFADRADLLFVYVRTDQTQKHRGISLVVVEKEPGTQFVPPTLTGTHLETAGFHGLHSFSLHFDDHLVPAENLIGGMEGKGFYQLMGGYEIARILIGFRCVGIAQAAYDAAFRYSMEREQFDKKIGSFQAVRFKLADMAAEIEAARALAMSVAMTYDQGGRCDTEAGMVKLFASEMAARVTWNAMILHGGMGYARDADVNRYWRDSALMTIGEGTSDIQREIIARGLYRAAGADL
jgi:alkylation response protein AidB-like acyl-CoA dehydrogenase